MPHCQSTLLLSCTITVWQHRPSSSLAVCIAYCWAGSVVNVVVKLPFMQQNLASVLTYTGSRLKEADWQ